MNDSTVARRPLDLILLIITLGGFLLTLVASGIIVIEYLFFGPTGVGNGLEYSLTTALSISFIGLCALPTCVLSARALVGQSPLPARPISTIWLVSIVLLPLTLMLGHLAFTRGFFPNLVGPPSHLLTAMVPAVIALVLVRRQGSPFSPRRVWGQFLIGLWAIPLASLVFEILTIIPAMVIIVLLLVSSASGQQLLEILMNPDNWLEPQIYESLLQT
ncbi:MAG: hypothetical protein JSV37_02805, partial [Anaerolineaceae bacterium]